MPLRLDGRGDGISYSGWFRILYLIGNKVFGASAPVAHYFEGSSYLGDYAIATRRANREFDLLSISDLVDLTIIM